MRGDLSQGRKWTGRRAARLACTGLAAAAVLGAGAAIGLGVIPSADGAIQGCYQKTNGKLRVVHTASDCTVLETPISWSQQGPPGPIGATGPGGQATLSPHVVSNSIPRATATSVQVVAACPTGEVATGGGYSASAGYQVMQSAPISDASGIPTGWIVHAQASPPAGTLPLFVGAICVPGQ